MSFAKETVSSHVKTGSNLLDGLSSIWDEYLKSHSLSPISIFITGSPKTGKTETAKSIADTLGAKYVMRINIFIFRNMTIVILYTVVVLFHI